VLWLTSNSLDRVSSLLELLAPGSPPISAEGLTDFFRGSELQPVLSLEGLPT
jgi:hypothetical protein